MVKQSARTVPSESRIQQSCLSLAMYQKNGQPAEKILRYYLQARFIRPKVRPYQTRNYYALLMKGDDTHDSVSEKE